MWDWTALVHLNAALNGLAAVLLTLGWRAIRQRRRQAHARFMGAAFVTSCLFLVSYLTYHFQVGSVRFQGEGTVRTFYFAVLLSHTVLAALVPPLAIWTLTLALRERFSQHRRWARWTLPIWIYVSVTGVVVYLMLYHLFPA